MAALGVKCESRGTPHRVTRLSLRASAGPPVKRGRSEGASLWPATNFLWAEKRYAARDRLRRLPRFFFSGARRYSIELPCLPQISM